MRIAGIWAVALLSGMAIAHPGEDINKELAERRAFLARSQYTDLSHCASKLKARGIEDRNVARRAAAASSMMKLNKRNLTTDLDTSHNHTDAGYTPATPESVLFSSNTSCALTPEATQGPYYINGEHIRRNLTETQTGVNLYLDLQVLDVNTCDPVPDVWLEIWNCNATGVYSGAVGAINGDGYEDPGNINTTFLRGIQRTDSDGVVQFDTIFPGHYVERATHVHILIHHNATELKNHTLGSGNVTWATHVGQAFFDQDLIYAVEATYPYRENTQNLTLNANDWTLAQEASLGADPIVNYAYLGDSVTDGLFAWMSFAINVTENYEVDAEGALYADGGRPEDSAQWTILSFPTGPWGTSSTSGSLGAVVAAATATAADAAS